MNPDLSLVVPVYCNEESIADLLSAVTKLQSEIQGTMEVVCVVDGSPDQSYARLHDGLARLDVASQLITLSRNFGQFSAVRVGLMKARGSCIAVMAADLQEPPSLIPSFLDQMRAGDLDVVIGVRESRVDPPVSKFMSAVFWAIYRRFVMRDVPKGGVDVFAISARFRDRLREFGEANSSLIAQILWLGGRRGYVGYTRQERQHGKSAWTLGKKFSYLSDSIFSFTDLPVRVLITLGAITLAFTAVMGAFVLFAKLSNMIPVPGYAGTVLVILFFGAFNSLGLGIVGTYAWRAFENTKGRPLAVIQSEEFFGPGANDSTPRAG